MTDNLKKYGILVLLLFMILPSNLFSVELFFGVNFIFGTIFVFLVAFMYGPVWSLIAGIISSAAVFFLWNHFYASPVFIAEALSVSLLYHYRKRGNPVEYVILFWLILGIPMGILIYKVGMGLGWEPIIMTILKQFLNSLFSASVAGLLLISPSIPFLRKKYISSESLVPLYEMISSVMIIFLLFGVLLILLMENRAYEKRSVEDVKERLVSTSDSFITYIEDWKERNTYNIYRLSYEFGLDDLNHPGALQGTLEMISATIKDLDSLSMADRAGQVIAYSPEVDVHGRSNLERNYSEELFFEKILTSLKPVYSEIRRSDLTERSVIGIAAPVRVDGQLEGFVYGAFYMDQMIEIMTRFRQSGNQNITLIDSLGRVIISTENFRELSLFQTDEKGKRIPRGDGVLHWFPQDSSSSMNSFQNSKLYYKSAIPDLNWTLYIEESMAPQSTKLIRMSLENNIVAILLVLILIPLLKIAIFRLTKALEQLVRIGSSPDNDAFKLWPETKILEFHKIIDHFKNVMEQQHVNNRLMNEQNRKLKGINAALLRSEDNLRITLRSIGDGVVVTSDKGEITDLNPVASRLTGWSFESAMGRNVAEVLILKEDLTGVKTSIMDKVLVKGESIHSGTPYKLEDKEGNSSIVTISAEPIRNNLDSDVRGSVIVIRNISQTRKLEEQLRQSQKLEVVGQLSGGIAHDFNNLLAGIMGLNKMIQSELDPDSAAMEYSENISQQITRAADLTNKLLSFSRKGKMISKVFDLHEVIDETVSILERTIDKTITIQKNIDSTTSFINGDPVQIQSVFMNIALNARDAMPKGGVLSFSTKNTKGLQSIETATGIKMITGPHIKISIGDTGTGMDEDVMSHIFEPFFTTKNAGTASGMSLSAVFGAVSEHNGIISVQSKPGEGTVFELYFPIVKNPAALYKPDELAIMRGDETILVIDDEEIIRNSLRVILAELGYHVYTASGGEEGLRLYKEKSREISLIILDAVMGDMPGLDVLNALKEMNPLVRVIIATGFSSESSSDRFREAGAVDFIGKPFTIDDLNSRIRKVLNH